jgi:hypothetical protein
VRQLGWDALLVVILGLVAVWFQEEAGFPGLLDPGIRAAQRVLFPSLVGIAFGVADVAVFELIARGGPHASLPPYLQPFPYSLLLYPAGAWHVETLYRLLPLTAGMALVTRLLPERARLPLFVVLAVATSVIEPLEQLIASPPWLTAYAFVTALAMNLFQAWQYRRSGWFAALSVRLGHYLVWHILLGLYVQYAILGR